MKRVHQRIVLGQRVRALRRSARMSQEQLGEAASLYRTYIVRIESGAADPTLSVLLRLAQALGVNVETLFGNNLEAAETQTQPEIPEPMSLD
ncbi:MULTISPECIES: helix-turn-helix domain-containing protein [Acidovorax]|uniref:helix-turn-helix domain-containing protein n=1 Tax=Acidovorax TaxID=12916 RepID=UPI0006F956C2|nr:helix-turn-helix transcriptional regulator [Acidovorax sp. Root70]KRB27772.1 hypothetical protein ASD94_08275 [Acidovorax sp. Root70]